MSTLVGSKLDKYEVLSEVGHGGMAVVYRGRDTVLDREVAIKVLHPHLADREESRRRLRREALTVAKLRHENILEIFDYSGEEASESYIVTEFIHGVTLREWLDTRWRPRPALAALVTHRLCVALAEAHDGGVIHRDLKPENVMIRSDGVLKLMDFGIAQIIDHEKLTMTGQLLGSPAYMAPELIGGKPLDNRTDLFALGIILYQLATGSLPFSGRNPHEVLTRIADADYPEPATVCPLVDDDLTAIIHRALAREPDDRFQTAQAFAVELAQYLEDVGVAAEPTEVRAYFKDSESYVHELDSRVCAALMKRAEAASAAGHSARAIRLLGRVLELEDDQKQAVQMLSRLRTRERRLRKLGMAAAAFAGFALVGAGTAYLLLAPPTASRLPSDDVVQADDHGLVDYHLEGHTPRRPKKQGRPIPGSRADAETDTGANGSSGSRERNGSRTKPPSPRTPAVKAAKCTLKIDGIPLQTAKHHTIRIGTQRPFKPNALEIPITLKSERTNIRLTGQQYHGSGWPTRDQCKPDSTITLKVRPQPTRLTFPNLPPNTVVECLTPALCKGITNKQWPASNFPRLQLNTFEETIKLRCKVTGYEPKTITETVRPGTNKIDVELKRR